MKTEDEPNALKDEYEAMNEKPARLTEDEPEPPALPLPKGD